MYKAHLFICTNGPDREGKCGSKGADQLLHDTKALAIDKKWGKDVRISKSGCLGQCEHGIACVIYPQADWHMNLKPDAAPELIAAVDAALKGGG